MSRLILCAVCSEKANQQKYGGPCHVCGMPLCPKHAHFYADESNAAITASARPTCLEHKK